MNNSKENEVTTPRLFLTENGAYFQSPIFLSSDQSIETPHKLPVAPHPSPINMDIESLNPKSKEVFRTELLKACQLKIPGAIANASSFADDVLAGLSYIDEDTIPNLPDVPIQPVFTGHHSIENLHMMFDHFPGEQKSNAQEQSKAGRDVEQFSKVFNIKDGNSIPTFEVFSCDFNQDFKITKEMECCSVNYSTESNLECPDDECSKHNPDLRYQFDGITKFQDCSSGLNHCKHVGEYQHPRINYPNENLMEYPNGGKSYRSQLHARPPTLNLNLLDSINRKDGTAVFYDHVTDHLEISKLLEVNPGWQESSICRSRSPCSDKMSTVAVCSSDGSDISDGDLVDRDRSMDFDEKDQGCLNDRRPAKKQQSKSSAMRRFLNWRRSLKFRKRTASLDESKFPFFANRFDSYKTEFELSV